ncbi:WXG100 family type VII secretion target [Stackebrandtia albiflava]|uniref:ESAT-6-like protein n=1 Tax=Stackebrandtia albiflava TaxID=406432 RepID=A0A562URX8_9ACTN|nr:WXG100 family type VII secretion target [Stackebrandtia albiflava]TWJ08364.1 WXG100 family type VII secretion target [Stackebrandtia albiflava]
MDEFEVKLQEVFGGAQQMGTTIDSAQNFIRKVQSEAQSSTDIWRGSSNTAFQGTMERFNSAANRLYATLEEIQGRLSGAANAHEQAEQEDAGSWNGALIN